MVKFQYSEVRYSTVFATGLGKAGVHLLSVACPVANVVGRHSSDVRIRVAPVIGFRCSALANATQMLPNAPLAVFPAEFVELQELRAAAA
jgi:hypothetical protein